MTIGLGSFASFARANPDADRVVVDGGQLKNDSQNTLGGLITWMFSGFITQSAAGKVVQDNRDAVNAFQGALGAHYGGAGSGAGASLNPAEPLTASRITNLISDAGRDARMAARDAAQSPPVAAVSEETLNAVMDAVKLPEGPHGKLLARELRQTLGGLHNLVAKFDATPGAALLPDLGRQLGARLEECVSRALISYKLQGVEQGRDDPLKGVSVQPVLNCLVNGLDDLCAVVPGLRTQLDAEKTAFTRNVTTLLSRLGGDLGRVSGVFFGGANVSAGLQGLTITSSDPHKGGNRVVILDFGNDQKVVYKPRDVRIDEALSGAGLANGRPSMMEIAGATELTYKFLPLQDGAHEPLPGHDQWPADANESGHYGYVEFLPNGSPDQFLANGAEAKDYYELLGRGAAAMMLAGAADLHHENIMVSGRKPYFSDLEFALTPSIHGKLADLMGQTDSAELGVKFGELMDAMGMTMGVTKGVDSNGLKPGYYIDADGIFQQLRRQDDVTESLLVVQENGQLLDTHGALAPPQRTRMTEEGEQKYRETLNLRYSGDFARGVKEGLISSANRLADYGEFLDDAAKLHVRVHPINTTNQRSLLSEFFDASYHAKTTEEVQTAALGTDLRGGIKLNLQSATTAHVSGLDQKGSDQRDGVMMDLMLAAYRDHDVPYFSRRMDDTRLFFNGDTPVSWGADKTQNAYFELSDAERAAVQKQLGELNPKDIDSLGARLGVAAKAWLAAQAPKDGSLLGLMVAEPKTVQLLQGLGAQESDFVQMDEPF
ncbi:DUF4135 domain-containing protein [Achromobacter deleyi]|uniref:DUF4135 domain-containing protein n=1 Tax=Achromobacter deleyi TaxID=1353891 RepID=UPI001492E98D|nr:DUF4135 domain-containing protein [Achromobacter deleyi]QVQ26431.1 DUF4135 domain-containing protein [Achromobacter deleyi]UIP21999.1 DUF4135 domain-containing protein [Achromobacter deleyi]